MKTQQQKKQAKQQAKQQAQQQLLPAIHNNDLEVIKQAIEKGANANQPDDRNYGRTPLHVAAFNGNTAIVEYLVKDGKAIVDLASDYGETPLSIAALKGYTAIVEYLAQECGAIVDLADNDGFTPLYIAAENGRAETVQSLVTKCGATVDPKELEMIKEKFSEKFVTEITNYLKRDAALDPSAKLAQKISQEKERALEKQRIADAEAQDDAIKAAKALEEQQEKELLQAIKKNNLTTVKRLISGGVNIEFKDSENGYTPLMYAASNGSLEVVKYLISKGANINVENSEGQTLKDVVGKSTRLGINNRAINQLIDVKAEAEEGAKRVAEAQEQQAKLLQQQEEQRIAEATKAAEIKAQAEEESTKAALLERQPAQAKDQQSEQAKQQEQMRIRLSEQGRTITAQSEQMAALLQRIAAMGGDLSQAPSPSPSGPSASQAAADRGANR